MNPIMYHNFSKTFHDVLSAGTIGLLFHALMKPQTVSPYTYVSRMCSVECREDTSQLRCCLWGQSGCCFTLE